jgi:cellulose binding protein with CBM2 domain
MLTPTFLAGFCTVLASILAYGTTQTHLLYSSGLPPACVEASCTSIGPHPGNGGALGESANPETHASHDGGSSQLAQPPQQPVTGGGADNEGGGGSQPGQAPGTHAGHPAAPRQHAGGRGGGSPGPRVTVVYRTQKQSSGRFLAAVTITNRGKTALSGWQLQMNYRRAEISHMWGARWFPADPRSQAGLATAPAGQRPLRPGMTVRFVFLASGTAGPPGGCAINGYQCSFRARGPRNPRKPHTPGPGRGHGHAHNPGTSHAHNPGSSQAGQPGSLSLQLTASVRPGATGPGHAKGHAKGHTRTKGHAGAKGSHTRARKHTRTKAWPVLVADGWVTAGMAGPGLAPAGQRGAN